jgi:mono/diheme cytochrome c family protein
LKIYSLKKQNIPKLAVLATSLAVAAMAATIQAMPADAHVGYTQNCNGCHSAGGSVTATPSVATPASGATYTVALRYTGGSGSNNGFWISGNGVNVTGGSSTSASMKAPAAAGTYTYTVWVRAGVVASTTYKITVAPVAPPTTTPPPTTPPPTTPPPTTPPPTTPPVTTPPPTTPPVPSTATITRLSSSHAQAGDRLTISGTGFAGSGAVKFGTVSASVSSWTSTRISVRVPNVRNSSRVLVTVTPAGGTASNAVSFRIDSHGEDD